jgi:4-amino-4-deoxy-L-arabinose transferase-like glycosyltransferase
MYARFGSSFINQYLFHEVIGRMQGATGKEPVYYYLVIILKSYWPWLLAAGYAVFWRYRGQGPRRRPDRDLISLGVVWVVLVGLLISLFPDKSPNYALPLYPVLSWIAAAGLCRLPWKKPAEWYATGFKWLAPGAAALLVLLSVLPIRFQEGPSKEWQALFAWMKKSAVAPGELGQVGLKPNDRCYYYVRTGCWLPEFSARELNGVDLKYVLSTIDANPTLAVVFAAGRLEVCATTNRATMPR